MEFLHNLMYNDGEVIYMTLGERVKACRKDLGWNAEELARRIKISPAQMYRYEKGEYIIPPAVLKKISEELEVSVGYLLGFIDDPDVIDHSFDDFNSAYDVMSGDVRNATILDMYNKLNDDGKRMAEAYLNFLLQNYSV